ncbi:MAG TPA: PEGA domain-containing protein [Polyangiaceae bacterium]
MTQSSRSRQHWLAFFAVSLLVRGALAAPPLASPSPPPAPVAIASDAERAAKLREEGNQAMLEMRYVDALAAYEQALALAPSYAGTLYSIARAQQLLGDFPAALTALTRFQSEASSEVKARVGQLDQLFAELRSRVGTLQLSCNVKGARVLVRDKLIGTTPLPVTVLPAGSATLELELDGFFTQKKQIVVPSAGTLSLELSLHARSQVGLLVVRTLPGGALVSVDGSAQGTSSPSIELALPAGPHRVSATRQGYDDASVPVVLNAGVSRTLDMPLERSVPLTSRWWFWTGTTAVILGGVALAVVLSTERSADHGTLVPSQISAPLHF